MERMGAAHTDVIRSTRGIRVKVLICCCLTLGAECDDGVGPRGVPGRQKTGKKSAINNTSTATTIVRGSCGETPYSNEATSLPRTPAASHDQRLDAGEDGGIGAGA